MSEIVRFTNNYSDHSTESGYQFEFYCQRCGNGYKSGFNASALGMGTKLLRGVGGLLGGRLGGASQAGDTLRDLTESKAKDQALAKAVEEIEPHFHQCHKCGGWVCGDICWNSEVDLCVNCAPRLEVELAGMQSERRLSQVREKVEQEDYAADVNVKRQQRVKCPHCGAAAALSGKFCGECGGALAASVECGRCGTEVKPGTKFCPECGDAIAGKPAARKTGGTAAAARARAKAKAKGNGTKSAKSKTRRAR